MYMQRVVIHPGLGKARELQQHLEAWVKRSQREGNKVGLAMQMFGHEGAAFAARATGPCATKTPCTGLEDVRRQIDFGVGIHICQTLRTATVSGSVVLGQLEARTDTDRANGVERLQRSFIAQVPK